MKKNSSKITKILYSLIVILTLNLVAPVGNFVMANDVAASEDKLSSIMKSYEDKDVYVKNGLSLESGEELNYKELLQPEEYNVDFKVTSTDSEIVSVEEGIICANTPGEAYIMLESEFGVYIYQIYVSMGQVSLYSDSVEEENETVKSVNGAYRVFIDAGHGGKDSGAVGNGLYEKNLTLAIALKVQMILKTKGIDVVMSRDTDKFLELKEISTLANNSYSDVFTSIHINSVGGVPTAKGIETYYYKGKTDSGKLATNVQTQLIKNTGANDRKVKTADFHVIREVNIPSILVECGFISNTSEAALMNTTSYQQLLAQGIADGIHDYLKANVTLNQLPGERVYGVNRYETSYKIARLGWNAADTVVIASGNDYPDALCAAPLATKYNAPILLAKNEDLSTQEELKTLINSLGVKKAYIVGGTGVIKQNFENELRLQGITTERLGGLNRYETSVKIAEKVGNNGEVAIAYGNGFADGLSISAVAAKKGMPILLTETEVLPKAVSTYINSNSIKKSFVIGGTGVVSQAVANSLPNNVRLSGQTRYETNQKIFENFKTEINLKEMYIALGTDFPDALSISALAGKNGSFVLLSGVQTLEKPLAEVITQNRMNLEKVYIVGGPTLIKDETLGKLNISVIK